jgi:hypothetical protein
MKTVGLASYPKLAADDATGDHYEENRERNFAFDSRWLNGTYSLVQCMKKTGKGILHLTVAGSMERTSFWLHLQEMNPGIVSGRRQYKGGGDRFEQSY